MGENPSVRALPVVVESVSSWLFSLLRVREAAKPTLLKTQTQITKIVFASSPLRANCKQLQLQPRDTTLPIQTTAPFKPDQLRQLEERSQIETMMAKRRKRVGSVLSLGCAHGKKAIGVFLFLFFSVHGCDQLMRN